MYASETSTGAALRMEDLKLIAEQEYCEIVFATKSKPASFRKYDIACNTYVRINVWCDSATVGICLDHPRQGKMQVFLSNVGKKLIREIFRSPRECAGYSDLKKPGTTDFAFGDTAQVNGYGLRGCARIIGARDHLTGLLKIQFGNGQEYRVDIRQLTKAHSAISVPKPQSGRMGKCQTLKNEARLQLTRLDRELEKLQQERQGILRLQAELLEDRRYPMATPQDNNSNTALRHEDHVEYYPESPTSFTRMNLPAQEGFGQADSLEFAVPNLEAILTDSGAFALPPMLNPAPPSPPSHIIGRAQIQDGPRMILPPYNYH